MHDADTTSTRSAALGRVGYGALFVVVLPAVLVAWAWRLDGLAPLSPLEPSPSAWWLVGAGAVLMAWAMLLLRVRGGGLPMNAFPPPMAVRGGPYAIFAHPIYVAAALVAFGLALALGSPAGAWIVAPALSLGMLALVLGYERADLVRRFGIVPGGAWSALPEDRDAPPAWRDVASVWLGLFVPFLVLYEAVCHLPVPDAILLAPQERAWPVWTESVVVYSAAYPFAVAASCAFSRRDALRRWTLDARTGIVLGLLAFATLPLVYPPRAFDLAAPLGWLLALEQSDGVAGRGSLPSFHAFWAVMCARPFVSRGGWRALVACALAGAICVSCATTGMHAIVDIVAGVALAVVATAREAIWRGLLRGAESVANSWREWRIGPVRVLSHAVYPGVAAILGVALVARIAGARIALATAAIGVVSLVGACLWGQYWTGSSRLLRPFGYFGSVLAVLVVLPIAALVAPRVLDGWALASALALAAPWMQAIGRLRCLVQGCCHGAATKGCVAGIRYRHPRSRVVAISGLRDVEVHATPVYSMLANLMIAALLLRMAWLGAPHAWIAGAYLVLAGLARFVEESLRGETQTQIYAGLRIYQWCAIASVVAGGALSAMASPRFAFAGPLAEGEAWWVALVAIGLGALHAFAMGVDFPESSRRFARLADATPIDESAR